MPKIKKATVCGSGIMGSGIAALLANVGIETYLLDISPKELTEGQKKKGYVLDSPNIRNLIVRQGLNNALNGKMMGLPIAFYSKKNADLIKIGNYDDNAKEFLGDSDWIIEVIAENLNLKKGLFEKIDNYRKPGSIVSTNTSGIALESIIDGRSEDLQQHFVLTHFFNPVRFMKLLEVTGCRKALPEVVDYVAEFGTDVLGKGVVRCKDTPGFVANRIGLHDIMDLMALAQTHGVETVDYVFGKHLGRGAKPFVVADMVGLDTLVALTKNLYANTNDEDHQLFEVPGFLGRMLELKMLGSKTGSGFYKGKDSILNLGTLEHEPLKKVKLDSVEAAKAAKPDDSIRMLFDAKDVAGEIFRKATVDSICYAANRVPGIADDVSEIDKAMNLGFNQKGPFETLDIIGLEKVIGEIKSQGKSLPELLERMVCTNAEKIYIEGDSKVKKVFTHSDYKALPPAKLNFGTLRKEGEVLEENLGARLYNIGKEVLGVEVVSKNGQIDEHVITMIWKALETVRKSDYRGIVIGNHNENFSVGADLVMLAGVSVRGWADKIEEVVSKFQYLNKEIKYFEKPVVVMKQGMCLGGGCELGMGSNIRTHSGLYTGLVELGVGLIPGGGGTKELLLSQYRMLSNNGLVEVSPDKYIQSTLELMAGIPKTVSSSAQDAMEKGYIRTDSRVSMNLDNLLYDAREDVVRLSEGYAPPREISLELTGKEIRSLLEVGAGLFNEQGFMPTPYLEVVVRKLAYVLTGGKEGALGRKFTEDEMLKLERDAFVELALMPGFRAMAAFQLKMDQNTLEKKGLEATEYLVR